MRTCRPGLRGNETAGRGGYLRHKGPVILLAALLIRVGFVSYAVQVGPDFTLTKDSPRYDRLALNLIHRFQFRAEAFTLDQLGLPPGFEGGVVSPGHLTDPGLFDGPEVKRAPLFPLFLGLTYLVTGYSPHAYLYLQALLSALTCWLLYRVGLQLGKPALGFAAALLLAINPRSVIHTGQLQVETYFILAWVLTFWMMVRYVQAPSVKNTALFGLLLGWVTLSREMGYYFVLLFLPAVLSPIFTSEGLKAGRRTAKILFLIAIPMLSIAGWKARNYHHSGHPVWSAHTEFTKVWFFGPKVMAAAWEVSEDEARLRIMRQVAERYPRYLPEYARLKQDSSHYWKFNHRVELNVRSVPIIRRHLLRHPGSLLSSFAGGAFWSLWSGLGEWRALLLRPGDYESLKESRGAREAKTALARLDGRAFLRAVRGMMPGALPAGVYVVFGYIWALTLALCVLAVPGTAALWRTHAIVALHLLIMIAFTCVVSGPAGNSRLLAPAYPFLSLLSAQGLVVIRNARRRKTGGQPLN